MTAALATSYTSTGAKLFWHQQAMEGLRNGRGIPICCHIMPTDKCNFKCSFCSVQYRDGDTLTMEAISGFLSQLAPLGLKSVILSGGGNPLLWRDDKLKLDFNDLISHIHGLGLQLGLITNGLPLADYGGRKSWKGIRPETLDKFSWIRLSLSGWDHPQDRCDTPDLDPSKTTLGGSYVFHDIYEVPEEPRHGSVSTEEDLIKLSMTPLRVRKGMDRLPKLKQQLKEWAETYHPVYCRLLPNCLQPDLIEERARVLQEVADELDPSVFFVQLKIPRQPHACYKGYGHIVLNCDNFCYPCDSVTLQRTAGHKFGSAWRICHWSDVGKFYSDPIRLNVPNNICPECVFSDQVDLIAAVVEDKIPTPVPGGPAPEHVNFI